MCRPKALKPSINHVLANLISLFFPLDPDDVLPFDADFDPDL